MLIVARLKRRVVSNVNEWRSSIVHWTTPLTSSLPVLATYHIRPLEQAFKSLFPSLSLAAC